MSESTTSLPTATELMEGVKSIPLNGRADSRPKDEYFEKFLRSQLDHTREYPPPVAVLNILQSGQVLPFLTAKSFSLWQGKQKSKKTTALAYCIAEYLKEQQEEGESKTQFSPGEIGTVLFFDTEQGTSYAARTMKLILKLCAKNVSPRLVYCDLREHSPVERWKIVQAGLDNVPGVKMVVIDGIVDLMTDFMDAQVGHQIITEIMRACSQYNVHFAIVLHQNKGDKNARAHVGSIASQKCEIEIQTEVDPQDKNRSIVSCVNARGIPFDSFAIRWDKGHLPELDCDCSPLVREAGNSKFYNERKRIADEIFKPLVALRHTEAKRKIAAMAGRSERTAIRMIDDMEMLGMIEKGKDELYRRKMPEVTSDTK